ncbi:hypothetical protein EIP86_007775 [Pleurotus ostreatoroseus]|nr:hypothetical protein EIP86_007775 [Pleurotus ostreatoroseus]
MAATVPNPINVEDCITATRALNKAVELKGEGKVSFAVIGGVAVASLTRKYLGPTPIINWTNVVNRQTKMKMALANKKQTLDDLWTKLAEAGYLPTGSEDPISAPGGRFLKTSAKYKLDRSKDSAGNPRTQWADVFFDIELSTDSRLKAYMNEQDIFVKEGSANATYRDVKIDRYTIPVPAFLPPIILLLKIESAGTEKPDRIKDMVDIGILMEYKDKAELLVNKGSFDRFRTKPAFASLKTITERWAKDNKKATEVVDWLIGQSYVASTSKPQAVTAWTKYLGDLKKIIWK